MTTKYVQPGEVIPYVNTTGSDIAVNALVPVGGTLCVALVDIPAGETGSVQRSGVFAVPKVAGIALAQGDSIDYDASEGAVSTGITPATGDITGCGIAFKAAGSAATTCEALLGFPGGTVN